MRGVSVITAKLWLDRSKGLKTTASQFHSYPATSVTELNLTHSPCCCYRSPRLTCRPPERWQLVYCLHSSLCCHGPLGNILQVNWHLTGCAWCGKEAACWESPISSGGRAFCSDGPSAHSPAPSSVSVSLCFPTAPARLHAWQTDRCYLPCISSSGPLSLSTNSPLLAHRLQILSASLPLDKGQYQWQNIFYVWNVAHNKQSSIRFV